jgi:uncharacterized iron-regulated membrane protein
MATRLYGLIWKWHFAAGLLACPLVAIVALTGALYAFQPEIDRWANAEHLVVEPAGPRRSMDELVAIAKPRCEIGSAWIPGPRDRSVTLYCRGTERGVFVDPYRGTVLGTTDHPSVTTRFFTVVFELHWELMLGDRGRLVIEWATSWTILLLVSGVILWWPRGARRGGGVVWPRTTLSGRQWLRDLHAVTGAYALPVLFALAATGLMWTVHAGDGRWNRVAAEPQRALPTSRVIEGAPRIGIDRALAGAKLDLAREPRSIWLEIPGGKDKAEATYSFWLSEDTNGEPWGIESILVDAYSGDELHRTGWKNHSTIGKVDAARYAIHVGAILGIPGRIAACLASLILTALCITGPWMWWKRRPKGRLGIPPAARAPWGIYVVLAGLGWLLPTVGVTLLCFALIEIVLRVIRRRRRMVLP